MGEIKNRLEKKLTTSFAPLRLEIQDDSAKHRSHSGEGGQSARTHGESHFNVLIVSTDFTGLSRVARQRLVYQCLSEELKGRVHALSLQVLAPEDDR